MEATLKEIKQAEEKLAGIKKTQDETMRAINTDQTLLEDLKKEIASVESVLENLNKLKEKEEEEIEKLRSEKDSVSEEILSISKEKELAKVALDEINSNIESSKKEHVEIVSRKNDEISLLQVKISEATRDFESKKKTSEKELSEINDSIKQTTKEKIMVEAALIGIKNSVDLLNRDWSSLKEEIKNSSVALEKNRKESQALDDSVVKMRETAKSLMEDIQILKAEISKHETRSEEISVQVNEEQVKLDALVEKRMSLGEKETQLKRLRDILKQKYEGAGLEFPNIDI